MKTFTDNAGRTWTVALNVTALKRVKSLAGVDLMDAVNDGGKLLERLASDPVLLCDVIFAVCKDQADAKEITDQDFGGAMAGDPIEAATTALLEELVDFFPKLKREVLRRALQKMRVLARMACDIEINRLGEPVGKQDQYISAYGGMTCFDFQPDGTVAARPIEMSVETRFRLQDDLLLFFTGFSRSAGSILKEQNTRSQDNDPTMLEDMDYVKELGYRSLKDLEAGRTRGFGEIMHEHWEHKKRRSRGMSNPQIDEWYDLGRRNGAVGGKLVGAGGGGFLMFYAEDHARLRTAMAHAGLTEVRFAFEYEGAKVIAT